MDDNFIVNDSGIYIKRPEYGENICEQIMPKEVFIEAYNKYICKASEFDQRMAEAYVAMAQYMRKSDGDE